MKFLKSSLIYCLLGIVFLASSIFCQAQEVTAAITGSITDQTGAPISGASIIATDRARGTAWPTVTNSAGAYTLPRIPVGAYDVRISASGFQTAVRSNILLVLNQTARIDVQMQVGAVTQTVEVTSAAPLLQTDSTTLGTIINSRTNEAIPLATRNYVQLTLLAPGAVTTDPSMFTGSESSFNGGRPLINGNREQADNFILDGMDNNQVSENAVGYTPSVDAIEEFNMITQNASAEFGNFMGGIINATIKSGTNRYHGSLFEFFRNDRLNANDWAANWQGNPRSLLRWNEFGGTIGGPILRDKLFFFADYQGSRFDQPATANNFTVLTSAERTGDFSQLLAQQGVQLTYPGTKTPIPGNLIPTSLLSPQALAIMSSSLYPSPINNALVNNSVNVTHSYTNQDQGDVKIDWNASEKDRVFGRYSQAHIVQPTTNSIALLYNSENTFPSYNGVVDYTRTFSPTMVNDFRAGVNYIPVVTGALTGTAFSAGSVGIPGVPTDVLPGFCFGAGNLSNVGCGFGNPQVSEEFSDTVGQLGDTVILNHGKHTVRLGAQIMRQRINTFYSGNAGIAGQFDFNGQYSGAAEADFMLGLPDEVQGGIAGGTWGQRASVFSMFAQDDWRVSNNLTVNIGLRYEIHTPWVEVHNRQANFGLQNGQEYLAGSNCPFTNCEALYNTYFGIANYQPRIGIAWTPWGKKTVIRAAGTVSSFLEGTGTNLRPTLNPPFATEHDITYTPTQTPSTLAQGYLPFGSNTGNPFEGASLRVWDPNIRPAVSQQWNITVQHQFTHSSTVQVGYVGQSNNHLMVPIYANQEILNPDGSVSPGYYLSGNPTLKNEIGAAKLTQTSANQHYEALQATFQQRLNRGLEFQFNYTWSKCMTNSIGYYGGGGQASTNIYYWPNTYDASGQTGPCYYDATHVVNGYFTYDVPFGRGRTFGSNINKAADLIAGGWQVSGILTFRGGFPYTIGNFEDSSQTHAAEPRADCIAPGNVFGQMNSPTGGYQWFDPNSYAAPALGTFGNCGVGTVRGPGLATVDLSLSKTFAFTERQSLEFRAEAINLANTPILGAPNISVPGEQVSNGNIGIGNFGQITSSQGARNVQFALKYRF
ncbi:MAG TPA: carboxypeptidase regulatory-like domain-containing protein [Bryobacteraceae bacterium]|nr:carboxypeptidase regulatory-like domain-containing protein [Bryobacteraceae bacterium]